MRMFVRLWLTATIVCSAVSVARAEDKVAAGHELALKVCSACHVVAKDQDLAPILRPPAPSFFAIAHRLEITEAFLRQFLSAPHGNRGKSLKMPNPQLVYYQIDEVVAYMLSLKGGS
jgi:mono/diheme cytochrome c family protein